MQSLAKPARQPIEYAGNFLSYLAVIHHRSASRK
jgi:hypothetical protein